MREGREGQASLQCLLHRAELGHAGFEELLLHGVLVLGDRLRHLRSQTWRHRDHFAYKTLKHTEFAYNALNNKEYMQNVLII